MTHRITIAVVQGIVIAAHDNAWAVKVQTRMGEAFEIQIDPIIRVESYRKIAVGD